MSFSKYEREEFINSKYYYKDTDVLINKLGIKEVQLLKEAEIEFTTQRTIELYEKPIVGSFSVTHLKNIHKYMFQDLYYFAGRLRNEDISKGDTMFCKHENIADSLKIVLLKLKRENCLKGLEKKELCLRLSFYFAEINLIHPFREGNGRAIREFVRQIVLNAGYNINWSKVNSDQLLSAMIESVDDIKNLNEVLLEIVE